MKAKIWMALTGIFTIFILYTCCFSYTAKAPNMQVSQQMQEDAKIVRAEPRPSMTTPAPPPSKAEPLKVMPPVVERNLAIPKRVYKLSSAKSIAYENTITTPLPPVIKYTDIKEMHVGVPVNFIVNIGTVDAVGRPTVGTTTMSLPDASYYLIGLEAEFAGDFDIKPLPGQEQKQHRAQDALTASWRYEVTPLTRGAHKLLYTLRVYQENDEAGTVIQIQPVTVQVDWTWASVGFLLGKFWIAVGSSTAVALAGLIKWLYDRKKS